MTDIITQFQSVLMKNSMRGNRFGTTAEDVFQIAYLMSAISNYLPKSDVKNLREDLNIHEKVWQKFVRVSNDPRLNKLRDLNRTLPGCYTALYALSTMKDIEFKAFISEVVLKEDTSSRYILNWTKEFRELCQFA